jgi:hypothetical protein
MKFFKNGLSVDETKVSALIVGFLITLGFSMWQIVKFGDIRENTLSLLGYLIMAITGVNVVGIYGKGKNKKSNINE